MFTSTIISTKFQPSLAKSQNAVGYRVKLIVDIEIEHFQVRGWGLREN